MSYIQPLRCLGDGFTETALTARVLSPVAIIFRTNETFFSDGGPRTLGAAVNAARPLEGHAGDSAPSFFAFSCQHHPGFRNDTFVTGTIMRH